MNCGRVSNQLSAYIDRELTGTEMLQIRAHLGDDFQSGGHIDAIDAGQIDAAATEQVQAQIELGRIART